MVISFTRPLSKNSFTNSSYVIALSVLRPRISTANIPAVAPSHSSADTRFFYT